MSIDGDDINEHTIDINNAIKEMQITDDELDFVLLSSNHGKVGADECNKTAFDYFANRLKNVQLIAVGFVIPPANFPENKKDSWHYYAVMKATKAIYQRQREEIDFLKLRHSRHAFWAHFHTVEVDTLEVNMDVLLDRHRALNAINIALIKPFINPQSKWLDISGSGYFDHRGFTRIPEELFEDKTLESYWQKLEIFDCYGNKIHQLPVFIGKLLSLQRLNCSQNKLKRLPEEIGNLVNLTTLEFQFNEIEELPKSIGNLAQLWMLACANNHLSSLPDSIYKLVSIRLIDINTNNLTQLPNMLFELKKLCQLDCRYNRIQQVPALLQAKFGEEWSTMTLLNQCEMLTEQTVFLPLFELNGTQALNHLLK